MKSVRIIRRALLVLLLAGATTVLAPIGISLFVPIPVVRMARNGIVPDSAAESRCWVYGTRIPLDDGPPIVLRPRVGVWVVARFAAGKHAPIDPTEALDVRWADFPLWAQDTALVPPTEDDVRRNAFIGDYAFGWPFPALMCRTAARKNPNEVVFVNTLWANSTSGSGITASPLGVVPARVVWGGLLGDFAVFTGAWGGAVVLAGVPSMMRSRLRSKRGLCPRCGYPVHGLSKCPECGYQQHKA